MNGPLYNPGPLAPSQHNDIAPHPPLTLLGTKWHHAFYVFIQTGTRGLKFTSKASGSDFVPLPYLSSTFVDTLLNEAMYYICSEMTIFLFFF